MVATFALRNALLSHLLGLFGTPAYVTDDLNRVCAVNRAYAVLVGDPIQDGVRGDDLIVNSLIIGSYRECFPRRYEELASCTPLLMREIRRGNLRPELRILLARALSRDSQAAKRVGEALAGATTWQWDGFVLIKSQEGRTEAYAETVVPLDGPDDNDGTPRYINIWTRAGERLRSERAEMVLCLSPREREAALLFAGGHTATTVADSLGISVHTARDYRDSIYSKLGIHSRAELGRLIQLD